MSSSATRSNVNHEYIVKLAEKGDILKSDFLMIIDPSTVFDRELYVIDDIGIRLEPSLTDPSFLKNLFPQEVRELVKAESDARLPFPCTARELLDWRERNEPCIELDREFIDRYNSARSLFDDLKVSSSKALSSSNRIPAKPSGQAKIENYNKKNSEEINKFWEPLIEQMQKHVLNGFSYLHAARIIARGTGKSDKQFVNRFNYEIRTGKIPKPIPSQS